MYFRNYIRWGVLSLCIICVGSLQVQAQVDTRSGSLEIKGKEINEVPQETTIAPFDYKKKDDRVSAGLLTFKSQVKLTDPFAGEDKRKVEFIQGNDFVTKEYKALEKKLNKSVEPAKSRDAKLKPDYYKDQNLGEFRSGSKFVNFVYRDHQFVDGDRVSVSINDTIVNSNVFLAGEFRGFYIDLAKGFNKIEITALNQGTSGPNTAQFIMYDDQKNEISSNIWNLATGVTASVIIIKD